MAAKAIRDVLRVTVGSEELIKRVEDFQFSRRLNSRVEALLQLIEIGLEANSPGSAYTRRLRTGVGEFLIKAAYILKASPGLCAPRLSKSCRTIRNDRPIPATPDRARKPDSRHGQRQGGRERSSRRQRACPRTTREASHMADDVPRTTARDLIAAHIDARAKVDGYIERNRLNVIFVDPRMEALGNRYSDFQELTSAVRVREAPPCELMGRA